MSATPKTHTHTFTWHDGTARYVCRCRAIEAQCTYCAKRLGIPRADDTPTFCGENHAAMWRYATQSGPRGLRELFNVSPSKVQQHSSRWLDSGVTKPQYDAPPWPLDIDTTTRR